MEAPGAAAIAVATTASAATATAVGRAQWDGMTTDLEINRGGGRWKGSKAEEGWVWCGALGWAEHACRGSRQREREGREEEGLAGLGRLVGVTKGHSLQRHQRAWKMYGWGR